MEVEGIDERHDDDRVGGVGEIEERPGEYGNDGGALAARHALFLATPAPAFVHGLVACDACEDGVQNAVDEFAALGGGESLGDIDCLVDGHLWRDVGEVQKFGDCDLEYGKVDRRHAGGVPMLGNPGKQGVAFRFGIVRLLGKGDCKFLVVLVDSLVGVDDLAADHREIAVVHGSGVQRLHYQFAGVMPRMDRIIGAEGILFRSRGLSTSQGASEYRSCACVRVPAPRGNIDAVPTVQFSDALLGKVVRRDDRRDMLLAREFKDA